jgi:peptide-methionine (S)-S-oxide reductase
MRSAILVLLFALLSVDLCAQPRDGAHAVATFAGGCVWCLEAPFDALDGVIATTTGYTGGHVEDPTDEAVDAGDTGHLEAVQVTFDPGLVSYAELLHVFWRNVDPLDAGGQFCDRGPQYRSAIFVHSESQERLARRSKQALARSGELPGKIRTAILPAQTFFAASEEHQDYYRNHPLRYRFYRFTCGRDGRLEELWGAANAGDVLSPNHP